MHEELSTAPTSGFVRIADIMRRTDEGVEVLRGCMHMTTTSAGTESVDVDSDADWWGIVIDDFGLRYGDLPADERARVWGMVRSAHERGTQPAGVERILRPATRYFRSARISEAARSPLSTAPLR